MNYKLLRLLFHIGFICVYQHILLLALVFPALMASKVSFLFLVTVIFNLLEPLKNTVLPKKGHCQVLNATKLILNDQGGYSDLSIINSESESF